MSPELIKQLIVDSLSVVLTALFTGIPAALLFWWTWQRDQERLVVQKLFLNWQTITGNWVSEKDKFGPTFGILVRNRSLFPVHLSAAGFDIDGTVFQLEHPMFPMKMKRNPDPVSPYTYFGDEESDPQELPSLKSVHVSVNPADRPRIAAAVLAASEKHNVSTEELIKSWRVAALVALETGKQFTSMPLVKRIWRAVRDRALRKQPRLPASEIHAISPKTGARTNEFALGFILATTVTILFSLLTWGTGPTPKRLLFSLVGMFSCAVYLMWSAVNYAAGRLFKAKHWVVIASRCVGILLLALGTTLWGRELWPKPPLIEMRISPSGFPVSIPPHSLVSILRIHPYISLTDSTDWLLKDSNDTGTEFFWPSQPEIESKSPDDHETVYRVEIIDHSPETLVSEKLSFQLQYSPGSSSGCVPSADSVKREDVVLIPELDSGKSFEFYAINQSNLCAWLIPPNVASVKMINDEAERQVPLTFGKNPLYSSGTPSFMPTKIKWEALPKTPEPHYQIQRITH